MPKKVKVPEKANEESKNAAVNDQMTPRGRSTGAKKKTPRKKTAAAATRPRKRPEPVPASDLPDEAVRIRAYFISQHRKQLALPGDESSDWLEAKRQLLSELGPR